MKQIIIPLLFLLMATSYVNSQTVVKLLLPKNCSESTTTKIDNQKADNNLKLEIYPNPNNGNFSLNLSFTENIGKGTIYIYNILGGIVYTETVFCNTEKLVKQIDLKNLLSGTYIIKFSTDNKEVSNKLIIK